MTKKIGVNDKCPCESGKKYKKCCKNIMAQKVKNADGLKKLFTEIYKRLEATSDKSEEEKSRVLAECKDAVENTTLDNTLVLDMNYHSFTMYTNYSFILTYDRTIIIIYNCTFILSYLYTVILLVVYNIRIV